MSIESFIRKISVQTAVYWGSPSNDGFGGKTFAEGVEIPVRWQDKKTYSNNMGETATAEVIRTLIEVMVSQDLELGGYLYLGTLDDLNELGFSPLIKEFKPNQIDGAYLIKGFDKIPLLKSTTRFVRMAYL